MQPLSEDDDKLIMYDDTIHIAITSTVIASSKQSGTFHMYTTQFVCGQSEEIAICGVMNKNPKWKNLNPLGLLPDPNTIISFDSVLDRFEKYTPPNCSHSVTCAVVAVQDITFLQGMDEGKTTAEQKDVRDRVKGRMQKMKTGNPTSQPDTPDASQTSSIPSSSQKTLGKQKASSSEDNIDTGTSL